MRTLALTLLSAFFIIVGAFIAYWAVNNITVDSRLTTSFKVMFGFLFMAAAIYVWYYDSTLSNYAFNEVFEQLKDEESRGLVQGISGREFEDALHNGCVLFKREDDSAEDTDDVKDEKVESKEGFRWMRYGRYGRGRWRGYPYYRYWRYPYSRFIRYPYYARGPARWVVYDGDYYYVTV